MKRKVGQSYLNKSSRKKKNTDGDIQKILIFFDLKQEVQSQFKFGTIYFAPGDSFAGIGPLYWDCGGARIPVLHYFLKL
jgi:hypothetical protein